MENNDQRPSAALINREWFEAAAQILTNEELGRALLNAVSYVLYGDELPPTKTNVGIVCRMIKPALDSDITKYRERCARNAANARSAARRVAASGTESLRVGANTTTTSTPTTTPTSTTTTSLSPFEVEEREKWLIYGYFWSTGCKAINEEMSAFWSYYEALGWKNNKGAQIVSKLAAARMWRRQYETGQAHAGADVWFKVAQTCDLPDYGVWKCFAGAERVEDHVLIRLRCSEQFCKDLREHISHLDRSLQALWRTPAVEFELIR